MFGLLEFAELLLAVVVIPLWILLEPSLKVQSWLMAVELPLLVWLTWQVASYQR
jgi:hypothetical protein